MANIFEIKKNVVSSALEDKIFLFYGKPGTWKTTVATGDKDKTLLLAYEVGYKFIPGIRAVNLKKWVDLKDTVRQLNTVEGHKEFTTVVIDTIGLAYKACVSYICARENVTKISEIPYGQGYGMAQDEFEKVISLIPQLGYGLFMIAHSDELVTEDSDVTIKVDINKRPSSVIKGMADFILYARKEERDPADGEGMGVYAYSETSNPGIEVKTRARCFPKRFFFTYDNLKKSLKTAISEQNKLFGTESTDVANFDVYKETEIDLPLLQQDVIDLAQELMETSFKDQTVKILTTNLNVQVSKTTQEHAPSLFKIKEELLTLKAKL